MRTAQDAGYDAYGCDIVLEQPNGTLRLIQTPYQLPFADAMFDFVGSNEVFEHVQNPNVAFAEIYRVLKPGGTSLHSIPARYAPIEGHIFVPLATVIHARAWLRLWAFLGIRNQFQRGMAWREVADINRRFLRTQTNYLRRHEIIRCVEPYFPKAVFVERHAFAASSGRLNLLSSLPLFPRIYSGLRARVLFVAKPE